MTQIPDSDRPDLPEGYGTSAAREPAEAPARESFEEATASGEEKTTNALDDMRTFLSHFEDALRARAAHIAAAANGAGLDESDAPPLEADIEAAAEEVARCRAELDRLQPAVSEPARDPDAPEQAFDTLREDLVEAGRRTEKAVESLSEALDRIDAERLLLAEQYAEHTEMTRSVIERWRGEQADAASAELDRFLRESDRVGQSMRESYATLGAQLESLRTETGGFGAMFDKAEKRLFQRFDEQQAELARQRGWIEQKLEEMRGELDRTRRSDMARTRSFVLILQFAAALLPVAAVALALFLPALLRWLKLGS